MTANDFLAYQLRQNSKAPQSLGDLNLMTQASTDAELTARLKLQLQVYLQKAKILQEQNFQLSQQVQSGEIEIQNQRANSLQLQQKILNLQQQIGALQTGAAEKLNYHQEYCNQMQQKALEQDRALQRLRSENQTLCEQQAESDSVLKQQLAKHRQEASAQLAQCRQQAQEETAQVKEALESELSRLRAAQQNDKAQAREREAQLTQQIEAQQAQLKSAEAQMRDSQFQISDLTQTSRNMNQLQLEEIAALRQEYEDRIFALTQKDAILIEKLQRSQATRERERTQRAQLLDALKQAVATAEGMRMPATALHRCTALATRLGAVQDGLARALAFTLPAQTADIGLQSEGPDVMEQAVETDEPKFAVTMACDGAQPVQKTAAAAVPAVETPAELPAKTVEFTTKAELESIQEEQEIDLPLAQSTAQEGKTPENPLQEEGSQDESPAGLDLEASNSKRHRSHSRTHSRSRSRARMSGSLNPEAAGAKVHAATVDPRGRRAEPQDEFSGTRATSPHRRRVDVAALRQLPLQAQVQVLCGLEPAQSGDLDEFWTLAQQRHNFAFAAVDGALSDVPGVYSAKNAWLDVEHRKLRGAFVLLHITHKCAKIDLSNLGLRSLVLVADAAVESVDVRGNERLRFANFVGPIKFVELGSEIPPETVICGPRCQLITE